jgi:FkbM family methyltransferase
MNDFRNYESHNIKFYKSLEDDDINFIKKYIDNPKVFLEFGSYDAGDAVFLRNNFKNTKIYSIEACPIRYNIIKNIENLFDLNVFNYAVCDSDGFIDFYQVEDPNVFDNEKQYGSSGSINKKTNTYKDTYKHLKELNPITVACTRIDTFCKNNKITNIDYMHVDTEGAELKVIFGFGDIRPKLLRLEIFYGKEYYGESAYDKLEIDNLLNNMNYTKIKETQSDELWIYSKII